MKTKYNLLIFYLTKESNDGRFKEIIIEKVYCTVATTKIGNFVEEYKWDMLRM